MLFCDLNMGTDVENYRKLKYFYLGFFYTYLMIEDCMLYKKNLHLL